MWAKKVWLVNLCWTWCWEMEEKRKTILGEFTSDLKSSQYRHSYIFFRSWWKENCSLQAKDVNTCSLKDQVKTDHDKNCNFIARLLKQEVQLQVPLTYFYTSIANVDLHKRMFECAESACMQIYI